MSSDESPSSQTSKFNSRDKDLLDKYKVFNDSVHGHISLHPLLVRIIDTPQFQRLRNVKQLGSCYYVFPGASHNRFEHCIGTCHLAGKLLRTIRNKQPELDITDEDLLCVEIAALCHDLGHGPFSHMFDDIFMKDRNPKLKWKHEDGSCKMLDYMIKTNDLKQLFEKYKLDPKRDVDFIKEMIAGPKCESSDWNYVGRDKEKSFLYEIVSNEVNKVDVDKWDYFARDCHHLGIKNSFDHNRFIEFVKVLQVDDNLYHICARDKEVGNLYEMFHTRNKLHRRAYQHDVCNIIESMICEAMLLADDYVFVMHKNGNPIKISEACTDMEAYTKLTDNIIYKILDHEIDNLDRKSNEYIAMKQAKSILQNITRRKIYKCVGSTKPAKGDVDINKQTIIDEITNKSKDGLEPDDLVIHHVNHHYGMKQDNPVEKFFFFKKYSNTPYVVKRTEVSHMIPEVFHESFIKIFCKEESKAEDARECFKKWKDTKNDIYEDFPVGLTPKKRKKSAKKLY